MQIHQQVRQIVDAEGFAVSARLVARLGVHGGDRAIDRRLDPGLVEGRLGGGDLGFGCLDILRLGAVFPGFIILARLVQVGLGDLQFIFVFQALDGRVVIALRQVEIF